MIRKSATLPERFWSKVEKTEGCWNWTGAKTTSGYGHIFTHGKAGTSPAHRVSYEMHVGVIPAGMEVDHMCHNTVCVRPSHLRLATRGQNVENRRGAQSNSKTGVRGVSWETGTGKYLAVASSAGRRIQVGRFATLAEAEAAVIAKRNEIMTHNIADRIAS